MPLCEPDPSWPGLAEDEVVPDDAPVCVADVTKFEFGIGLGTPHAGYHHNGFRTSAFSYAGAKVETEVTNPTVDHLVTITEFVVSRVLTKINPTGFPWIEIGWAEHSDRTSSTPEVYSYDTEEGGVWRFPGLYPLNVGSFYAFRTRNCTISSDDKQCAEVYWQGAWALVDYSNSADCRNQQGTAVCAAEEYTEIYSDHSPSLHPDLTPRSGDNRVDWRSTQLRTNAGSWVSWTQSSIKGSNSPYDACLINAYYRFYAVKGTC